MKHLFPFILLILVACTSAAEDPSAVQIVALNADVALDAPRISFALFDGPEPLADVASVEVTAVPVDHDAPSPPAIAATSYADYEIPYWVAYPEWTAPGYWGVTAEITFANGRQTTTQYVLSIAENSASATLGQLAPTSANKTIASEPDLSKLSSGLDPNPAFYQMTVAEAATSGKPTVVAFATPGLCASKWCAPVLDSVAQVYADYAEQANFIHIEVYDDFQALTLVPQMAEWGLNTEPWVMVLDAEGQVAAKLAGPLAPQELTAALHPVLP